MGIKYIAISSEIGTQRRKGFLKVWNCALCFYGLYKKKLAFFSFVFGKLSACLCMLVYFNQFSVPLPLHYEIVCIFRLGFRAILTYHSRLFSFACHSVWVTYILWTSHWFLHVIKFSFIFFHSTLNLEICAHKECDRRQAKCRTLLPLLLLFLLGAEAIHMKEKKKLFFQKKKEKRPKKRQQWKRRMKYRAKWWRERAKAHSVEQMCIVEK